MNDAELKARFDALREEELRAPRPPFAPRRRATRRRLIPIAAMAVLLLVVSAVLLRPRPVAFTNDDRRLVHQAAAWHSPTDFLLRTPGQDILSTTPAIPDLPKGLPQ